MIFSDRHLPVFRPTAAAGVFRGRRAFARFPCKKNVPWHILAPRAVACDSLHLRASAHLWHVSAFLCNREFLGISCYIKKRQSHQKKQDCRQIFSYTCKNPTPELFPDTRQPSEAFQLSLVGFLSESYRISAPRRNFRFPRIFLTNLSISFGSSALSSGTKVILNAMLFLPLPSCSPR